MDTISSYPLRTLLIDGDKRNTDATSKGITTIGNDVWIGMDVMVLSGVKIGDGAVIGARSVIASDVPPYSVVAGGPAQILRYRFSNEQIKKLLEIAWWNWPTPKIIENMTYFYSDIDTFLKRFG